jgi:hypothetical protein
MTPSKLPMPLNLLQAATANEISSLKLLFPVLAQALSSMTPEIDFSNFTQAVKELETKYTYWDELNQHLEKINIYHNQLIPALKRGQTIQIDLTETDINFFVELMKFLTPKRLLEFKRNGDTKLTTTGTFYGCSILPLEKLKGIWTDVNCKH